MVRALVIFVDSTANGGMFASSNARLCAMTASFLSRALRARPFSPPSVRDGVVDEVDQQPDGNADHERREKRGDLDLQAQGEEFLEVELKQRKRLASCEAICFSRRDDPFHLLRVRFSMRFCSRLTLGASSFQRRLILCWVNLLKQFHKYSFPRAPDAIFAFIFHRRRDSRHFIDLVPASRGASAPCGDFR